LNAVSFHRSAARAVSIRNQCSDGYLLIARYKNSSMSFSPFRSASHSGDMYETRVFYRDKRPFEGEPLIVGKIFSQCSSFSSSKNDPLAIEARSSSRHPALQTHVLTGARAPERRVVSIGATASLPEQIRRCCSKGLQVRIREGEPNARAPHEACINSILGIIAAVVLGGV